MLSALTLADAAGNDIPLMDDTKRAVVEAHGLLGIGPLRDSRRVRPSTHGAIDETRWEDGRILAFVLEVSSNLGVEDAFSELRAVTSPMLETLDVAPAVLKWTEGESGLALQRTVKLASDIDPPLQGAAAMLTFQVQFFAEDPRAYSQELTTAVGDVLSLSSGGKVYPRVYPRTYSPSSGGVVVIANAGNRPTPPILRIYGRCVNPQILRLDSDDRIVLNGTVPAGSYLDLDADSRTILLDGTTNRANFYDPGNSSWFDLPKNSTSNLRLIAGEFDGSAHLEVLARSAYA
jgi:hypothetical protein